MTWADAMVWQAVSASPQGTGDPKIGDTLYHIHVVQHVFLQAWTAAPFKVRERTEFPTVADIMAWGREAHRGAVDFIEAASAEVLDRPFRMPWANHFEERAKQPAAVHSLGESVLQAVMHSQHHRGQVCARLREVGGEPPTVDFIVWLWAGRPRSEMEVR
jgi:uncharacterized damage-inducible protein DinB